MQANILWTGREYYSLENCLVKTDPSGTTVESTIVGSYQDSLYRVDYKIQTNTNWETLSYELNTQVNGIRKFHKETLDRSIDIDIPLTPFTNTLPIRRLKLEPGEVREITVLYLDVLANEFKRVNQKYHRLSQSQYKYENVPNDFEATITVDDDGLVVDYPQLFVRTTKTTLG